MFTVNRPEVPSRRPVLIRVGDVRSGVGGVGFEGLVMSCCPLLEVYGRMSCSFLFASKIVESKIDETLRSSRDVSLSGCSKVRMMWWEEVFGGSFLACFFILFYFLLFHLRSRWCSSRVFRISI